MGRLLIQFPGTTTAKALTETLSKNVIIVDEDLHQLRLHDGSTAGGHLIGGSSGSGVPVGTIIPFAGNSVPQGYLLCDGSAISRTTYASLFAVIGTIYGTGDGNSTFNLPSVIGSRTITGINNPNDIGYKDVGGLPNITGTVEFKSANGTADGCFYYINNSGTSIDSSGQGLHKVGFDASRSSGIYNSNNTEVQPKRILMYFIVKY